ncbi:MAG TPA: glycoside hydrolase family 57 protein [Vicinamibacterales bacterium]|nr:glycoside hydrolase family 57 protein [Vicinamibacterales bacterium]
MTRVALLWHMHQPFYQDLVTGEHILPWVRLHAIKDYWGMVALLREFPDVRVTFNLVPSMLVQIDAFARGEARDRHLEIGLTPADRLTDDERAFCVEQFFHAHRPRMIDPYPRYAELLALRGDGTRGAEARARAAQFSVDDLRDLQVWHKLAWIDAYYFDRDVRTRSLVEKGRQFTEDDKSLLRTIELEILRSVVPEYRDAAARGQVELATSPFYHPILPLLCDSNVFLRTHPDSRMPRERFAHPEDALEQLTRAVALHEQLFGERPRGLWPSEGAVSDAMVPLVARAGFEWMATDEEILSRTLGQRLTRDGHGHVEQPHALYRAYRVGTPGQEVACGFRDHTLSDLIGFTYASWPPVAAAEDFVGRLEEAGRRCAQSGGEAATIFVILDGENAWEHYDGQGRPFLRAVYSRLAASRQLRTVTMSEACAGARERLPSIFPGSWINGDFYIWIGHADDHRAWGQLAEARRALESPPPGVTAAAMARAWEELLIAEGSDWFWWYGDDHSSDHDMEFDDLFRRHVQNVYRALDKPVPEELFVTNISTIPPEVQIDRPTGFIQPVLDGEVTSYFEWVGAGSVEDAPAVGTMHQVAAAEAHLTVVEFGFDLEHLFVRVTATVPVDDLLSEGLSISVNFLAPAGVRVLVRKASGALQTPMLVRHPAGGTDVRECPGIAAGSGRLLEVQIPFRCLGLKPRAPMAFLVGLNRGPVEVEHHPRLRAIELSVPDAQFAASNWTA